VEEQVEIVLHLDQVTLALIHLQRDNQEVVVVVVQPVVEVAQLIQAVLLFWDKVVSAAQVPHLVYQELLLNMQVAVAQGQMAEPLVMVVVVEAATVLCQVTHLLAQ
jgi:hypothetical protein